MRRFLVIGVMLAFSLSSISFSKGKDYSAAILVNPFGLLTGIANATIEFQKFKVLRANPAVGASFGQWSFGDTSITQIGGDVSLRWFSGDNAGWMGKLGISANSISAKLGFESGSAFTVGFYGMGGYRFLPGKEDRFIIDLGLGVSYFSFNVPGIVEFIGILPLLELSLGLRF